MTKDTEAKGIVLLSGLPSRDSVLTPNDLIDYVREVHSKEPPKVPKYCILGFFKEMYDYIEKEYNPDVVHWPSKKNPMFDPIHIFNYEELEVSYVFPGIGSPSAVAMLEMMVAFGAEYFIFLGGVGVLTEQIERGEIIVPSRAIRDEGTSFHYQEPSRYSHPSPVIVEYIKKSLEENKRSFHEGGTWTTDAFFRETLGKVKEFLEEGCLTVEMEASALFSAGEFREVHVGGLFTAGDCVAGPKWDARREKGEGDKVKDERRAILVYALDAFRILNLDIS